MVAVSKPSPATRRAAQTIAERVRRDPLFFSREILGHDHWAIPERIMFAVSRPRSRTAVKACHASSKTFTAADVVLWWTYAGGIAVTTAPTWVQVKKLLWGEIHTAYEQARYPLGGTLLETELKLSANNYAMGLSTNQGVRFQGWHGQVLIVIDEAPGVDATIWEAVEGIRAGGDVRVLALGNPVVPVGPFFEAFGAKKSGWQTFTIDAFDTPNLAGLTLEQLLALPEHELHENERPYLVTRDWVVEKYHEWGVASPLWQARARGQFPEQSENALISLAWLDAAQHREPLLADDAEWVAGIDVAGPGESETVLALRHGGHIAFVKPWTQADPRGELLATLAPYQAQIAKLRVDAIGQGYYFARHLEDNGYKGRVEDVNVGVPSSHPLPTKESPGFANLKAELYWGLRQRFQAGDISGLSDDLAYSQLAGIQYQHNARGQVVIESKEEAQRRGVKSPDRAEAIMLAFGYGKPKKRLRSL